MMATVWKKKFVLPVLITGMTALVGLTSGVNSAEAAESESAGVIGVSVPTLEGPFFTSMIYGILDEAKKSGYEVNILSAGSYQNVDTQVSQIETLTSQNVDIMLVDPSSPVATRNPIRQAVREGIIVVGAGDPAPGAHGSASAPHCSVGKDLAAGARILLPNGGTLGVLAGPAGAFWSTERLRCFKEDIADTEIEIVAEKTSEPSIAEGLSIASDFLQRFPELDLIYGADDTVGDGAGKAVEAADLCGKTQVLTAVFGQQAEDLMRKGCINYDVALQPVLIGREAVRLGIDIRAGNTPSDPEITVPNVAVTPENIDTVDIDSIRSPDGWRPPL